MHNKYKKQYKRIRRRIRDVQFLYSNKELVEGFWYSLEEVADIKGVIRTCKSNGQNKKDRKTHKDIQNAIQKTRYWTTRTPLKNRGWNQVLGKDNSINKYQI
jgi:DNA mismatch repair ATPase MutS